MNWPEDFIDRIICGDCLNVMRQMPDACIDLTITSPPYNLGKDHHTNTMKHTPYFDNIPEGEYQAWQTSILKEIYRITKLNGSCFYNHKNRIKAGAQISPYQWIFDTPWIIKQEIAWWNGGHNFDPVRFFPQTERIYWLSKDAKTKLNNNTSLLDVWHISPVGTKFKHTRQFPEQIVWQILNCFPDANIVFDPFVGSGTVARLSMDYRKNFIGIDIKQEFCEMSEKRIAQGVL